MLVECMSMEEKIVICNRLGELARNFLAEGDFSKSAQLKFYKKVLTISMDSLNASPTVEMTFLEDSEDILLELHESGVLKNTDIYPILIDNIMFRSIEHAYYYFLANQDYIFLAKVLSEDLPNKISNLFNRSVKLKLVTPITDNREQVNIMYSLVSAKFAQHLNLREEITSKKLKQLLS